MREAGASEDLLPDFCHCPTPIPIPSGGRGGDRKVKARKVPSRSKGGSQSTCRKQDGLQGLISSWRGKQQWRWQGWAGECDSQAWGRLPPRLCQDKC